MREKPKASQREREAYVRWCIVLFQLAAASRRWMDPSPSTESERRSLRTLLGPLYAACAVALAQRTHALGRNIKLLDAERS